MRLNREKACAALGLLILALVLWGVITEAAAPVPTAQVDITLPSYSPTFIPRKFRVFEWSGSVPRNPFSLSEGWQGMEAAPMAPPPIPEIPRPLPSLGAGPSSATTGFLYKEPEGGAKEEGDR